MLILHVGLRIGDLTYLCFASLPAWMTSPEALPSLEHGHVSNIITSANKLTAILSNFRRAIAQQTIATLENALHMHARKQGTISMNILCRTTYRSRGRFRTVLARQPWPRIHLELINVRYTEKRLLTLPILCPATISLKTPCQRTKAISVNI